ncbi:hypothetical protein ACH4TX_07230 [Streptomyces sp. NPDC021098]|uniref:hypothetical protein n=1 Tax=unclassified Streptomyces TaxID=2593676 RepID=UPI00379EE198
MMPGRGWRHWAGWLAWLLPLGLVGGMFAWTDDLVGAAFRYAAAPLVDKLFPDRTEPHDSRPMAETSPSGEGPLVAVHVTPHVDSGCGTDGGWVFPVPAARLDDYVPGRRPSRDGTSWDRDPYAFGGAAPNTLRLGLSVSARGGRTIVLKGFTVNVVKRAKPMKGTVLDPRPVSQSCGLRYGGTKPLRFPYKVTGTSPVELDIDVSTRHCTCAWTGRLDWSDGTVSGTTTITDERRPFRTTPADGLPVYRWDGEAWRARAPGGPVRRPPGAG